MTIGILIVLFAVCGAGFSLLPSIIAVHRKHHNATAIFAANVFLGWTFLGWAASLVWACTHTSGTRVSRFAQVATIGTYLLCVVGLYGLGIVVSRWIYETPASKIASSLPAALLSAAPQRQIAKAASLTPVRASEETVTQKDKDEIGRIVSSWSDCVTQEIGAQSANGLYTSQNQLIELSLNMCMMHEVAVQQFFTDHYGLAGLTPATLLIQKFKSTTRNAAGSH